MMIQKPKPKKGPSGSGNSSMNRNQSGPADHPKSKMMNTNHSTKPLPNLQINSLPKLTSAQRVKSNSTPFFLSQTVHPGVSMTTITPRNPLLRFTFVVCSWQTNLKISSQGTSTS